MRVLVVLMPASAHALAAAATSPCVIKVVGVGGGGTNAVNRMIQYGQAQTSVEYWAVNTDVQALDASLSPNRLGLGAATSRGLGAGGSPDTGAKAAAESIDQIGQLVDGSGASAKPRARERGACVRARALSELPATLA